MDGTELFQIDTLKACKVVETDPEVFGDNDNLFAIFWELERFYNSPHLDMMA